jgi:hypothetical protein
MFDTVNGEIQDHFRNGRWFVAQGPVSPDPGQDDDPARVPGEPDLPDGDGQELPPSATDWLTDDEWLDWLSTVAPGDEDPEDNPGQATRGAKGSRGAKG